MQYTQQQISTFKNGSILKFTPEAIALVRHYPVQQRGFEKLANILLASAIVINHIGRDDFTTQQVAAVANVSIGSVYRYFADRGAILEYLWPTRPVERLVLEGLDDAQQRLIATRPKALKKVIDARAKQKIDLDVRIEQIRIEQSRDALSQAVADDAAEKAQERQLELVG